MAQAETSNTAHIRNGNLKSLIFIFAIAKNTKKRSNRFSNPANIPNVFWISQGNGLNNAVNIPVGRNRIMSRNPLNSGASWKLPPIAKLLLTLFTKVGMSLRALKCGVNVQIPNPIKPPIESRKILLSGGPNERFTTTRGANAMIPHHGRKKLIKRIPIKASNK